MTPPATLQAVCFDVGQTILSPDYPFIREMLARFGVPTSIATLDKGAALGREKFFRGTHGEQWKDFFTFWLRYAGAPAGQIPTMLQLIYERHQREHLWNYLEPTAHDTFHALQAMGLRLGIISNADGKVARLLEQQGLAHFFGCVIDSHLVGVEKPDPKIFELALAQLQVPAASCLYVGDNYDRDVIGARRAGLRPVLLDPFAVVPENDVTRIKTLAEILEVLPRFAHLT
ncbi:MAG: HAD-IA family hydrolase [candidate division KSB1 bacterium]|nr:HAD-IA family hydrolase [candidate division KSB1 bacterium]MDZ7275519.1 HAD-IA family hydrolase [candidate division KSB1 bacterium]MDZ7286169.1 HAD-IA family hydrolase [candidate division KSB1 bacterium]MDZ7296395.1 HAD-IA family hydrolase [candidate division KSB1 bacterium]MDZ7306230.1 HAD-IA family hydrolase [candidate division KSB1 bacterium]